MPGAGGILADADTTSGFRMDFEAGADRLSVPDLARGASRAAASPKGPGHWLTGASAMAR